MPKASSSNVLYRKHKRPKPTISHGKGIYLYDTDGNEYIDASGGAVVVNIGHGVESVAEAIRGQANTVAYAHATMFTSEATETLAERLGAYLPIENPRLFFSTSGSEAVEAAIKLARQVQIAQGNSNRYKVIGRWGSYHGGTLGALAVMGKPSMRHSYDVMFQDMPHIPPVFCYRCPFGLTYPTCNLACATSLEDEIKRQGPDTVAAFIAEPISGATLGAVVPPDEYWSIIREICNRFGVLLIVDEVMTGVGRTGRWFAIEQWDVQPDIMTLGKGISGGYAALSATAVRGELVDLIYQQLGDFNHGGTYSHQPVASAAGVATLDYLEHHELITQAKIRGLMLGEKLTTAFENHPYTGDVRGQGMMWSIELVQDKQTSLSFPYDLRLAERIFYNAFQTGLIVYAMQGCVDGKLGDHVVIAPPYIVSDAQIDEIVSRLRGAVDEAVHEVRDQV